MLNLNMDQDDDKEMGVVIEPEEIPEAEWVTIEALAQTFFDAGGKRNYTKACVQAYFEWLEYTQSQTRH